MGQGVDELAVLVEAGRESDRAGEIDAGKPRSQPRVIDRKSGERRYSPPRQAEAQRELPDGVALIGRQPEQEWPEDAAIERHPRGSPGQRCCAHARPATAAAVCRGIARRSTSSTRKKSTTP